MKVSSPVASAACAVPTPISDERGTPPATVHTAAAPAQVMHSRTLRRDGVLVASAMRCSCALSTQARPGAAAIYSPPYSPGGHFLVRRRFRPTEARMTDD